MLTEEGEMIAARLQVQAIREIETLERDKKALFVEFDAPPRADVRPKVRDAVEEAQARIKALRGSDLVVYRIREEYDNGTAIERDVVAPRNLDVYPGSEVQLTHPSVIFSEPVDRHSPAEDTELHIADVVEPFDWSSFWHPGTSEQGG